MRLTLAYIVVLFGLASSGVAENSYDIRINGRREITVTTPTISLADLAEVTSQRSGDEETVIGLKRLFVEKAPAPGESLTISAAQLLARLREEGVDLKRVGYSFPRVMSVKRASRILSTDEIRSAIEAFLRASGKEIALKDLRASGEVHLIPGLVEIKAIPFDSGSPGRMSFKLSAEVEGQAPVNFNVDADVDEWREVPIAARPLAKGTLIAERDLVMARMNVNQIPRDAVQKTSDIIGLQASKDLNYGEVLRNTKIAQPLAVQAGDRVTMVYKKGLLEATAKGIAIDSGIVGQSVKVKNESSKRTVSGLVREQGLVEVQP